MPDATCCAIRCDGGVASGKRSSIRVRRLARAAVDAGIGRGAERTPNEYRKQERRRRHSYENPPLQKGRRDDNPEMRPLRRERDVAEERPPSPLLRSA